MGMFSVRRSAFGVQRSAVGVAAGLEVASPAAKPLADTRNAQGAASDFPPKSLLSKIIVSWTG
jgi:hypothetical protein